MSSVMESLRRDHANFARLLDAIERQIERFEAGEQPDYDVLDGALEYCLGYPDLHHHPREDLVHQHLRKRDPAAAARVDDLEAEHRELTGLTRSFAETLQEVLSDAEIPRERLSTAARAFLEAYRRHIEGEDSIFFPAAERALRPEDWADIEARMAEVMDPVFGGPAEKRFEALLRDVLEWERESG